MTAGRCRITSDLNFDFSGRTVAVTGAARGIGREVARFFKEAGAETFLIDLDGEEVKSAAHDIGATALQGDVSSTHEVEALISKVIDDTGRIDVIVNNAGILRDSVLWKMDDDAWESVIDVHLGGTFRLTRACIPDFRAQAGDE